MKLNLGCGSQVVDGWINVDYALGARLMKAPGFGMINRRLKFFTQDWNPRIVIHNLTKKFPWADSSAEIVYCSHILEHFTKEDGRNFLSECHRVLRTDGILRIIVPDLRRLASAYLEGEIRADDFIGKLGVLYENSQSEIKMRLSPFYHFPHKCMYDSGRLLEILQETGFNAHPRAPFDSDIPDIHTIELETRARDGIIMEGRKREPAVPG